MNRKPTTLDAVIAHMEATLAEVVGAPVCVTMRDGSNWTVSGSDAAVRAARDTMQATGCTLTASHFDDTPDADGDVDDWRYDYWTR